MFLQRSENADVHNSVEAARRRVVESDRGGKRLELAWDEATADQSSHMSGKSERMCLFYSVYELRIEV